MSTRALLYGLQAYREQLNTHMAQLQQEFGDLEMQWNYLNQVFSGDSADQFRVYWQQTVENFREYLERARRVSEVLEERIGYLEGYNRPSDNL